MTVFGNVALRCSDCLSSLTSILSGPLIIYGKLDPQEDRWNEIHFIRRSSWSSCGSIWCWWWYGFLRNPRTHDELVELGHADSTVITLADWYHGFSTDLFPNPNHTSPYVPSSIQYIIRCQNNLNSFKDCELYAHKWLGSLFRWSDRASSCRHSRPTRETVRPCLSFSGHSITYHFL